MGSTNARDYTPNQCNGRSFYQYRFAVLISETIVVVLLLPESIYSLFLGLCFCSYHYMMAAEATSEMLGTHIVASRATVRIATLTYAFNLLG